MKKNELIVTMAVLTSENPRCKGSTDGDHENTPQVRDIFEKNLRLGHYAWFPVKEQIEGASCSYIIYNISLNNALYLGGKYGQENLIFIEGGHCEYWEQNAEGRFQKRQESETGQRLDMTNIDDFFTQVCCSFNLQLPFFDGNDENKQQLVESIDYVNKTISQHINDLNEAKRRIQTTLTASSGYNRYCNRGELYRNSFDWN